MALTPPDLPETLIYEVEEHIATLTLNRPERYNAISPEMRTGIRAAFNTANADDEVWVIVFRAVGEKAFCAGADLGSTVKNLTATPETQLREVVPDPAKRHFHDVFKPIIAAINGICTAAISGSRPRTRASVSGRCAGGSCRSAAPTCVCRARSPGRSRWNSSLPAT